MALRDDLKLWDPMYIWQTRADAHGKIITAEEWNAYWNLAITQGDHSSEAIKDIRDMLYETVLHDTNGASAIKFAATGFTATDVSAALSELDAADVALASDYNNKLALKANLSNPTFTGTVGGITKAMVGLNNVDNTADSAKPISSAAQTALNAKADATALAAHKTSGDHDGRYAFLLNTTPFTPALDYHLTSVKYVREQISEAVISGIADNSIADKQLAPGNKKQDVVAAVLAQVVIPASMFDFDTPDGKAGWAYTITSDASSSTEIYTLDTVTKASRVYTYDTPSAGQTQEVLTCPDGSVITRIYNADGSATITEV